MVEQEIFPRGCLSLSRSLRQTKALPRDRNTDDVLSSLTQTLSFRSRRKDNDACVCPRRFPRACVQIRCRPMGKIDPQKLCALSLSCTSLETERRTKNVAREYSLSLDGLATSARLSRSRIRECKERERNDPKFVRKLLFFPLSFILQLSAHNFHRGLARANRRRAARSFQTQHTPGEDDDDEDEERRERICRDCLLLLPLYERVLLSFSLKMCCLLCVMTSNTILIFYR